MVTPTTFETTPTMDAVTLDDFATPITALDCEMQELEAERFENGIDIGDSRYI